MELELWRLARFEIQNIFELTSLADLRHPCWLLFFTIYLALAPLDPNLVLTQVESAERDI